MSRIEFFVPGLPVAQGSKRHIGNGVLVESAKGLKDWRHAITHAAFGARTDETWTGPVHVRLTFHFPRPKSHHIAGDPSRPLRASAPRYPTGRPDVDKLARAVLDAITASGVWRDDSQVVDLIATKAYATPRAPVGVAIDCHGGKA